MSVMTVTTRISRKYLERKTKDELIDWYLSLLDQDVVLENAAREAAKWEREYRIINNLGKSPDCFVKLRGILQMEEGEKNL